MKPEQAISILRVSTRKQMNEGDGIENQRRHNNDYIERKSYKLLKEFELAESADNKKRSEFDATIDYIAARKDKIQVVVMYKVDRLSRGGLGIYIALKLKLEQMDVRLEFSTQEMNSETPEGEIMEGMLALMARFENRIRVQRTIGVEKILTQAGYWCRPAPTGFVNGRERDEEHGNPILKPTPDRYQWDLLSYGLKKQMTGFYKITEVAQELRQKGFVTRKYKAKDGTMKGQNPLTPATWTKMCRSPVYGGLLYGAWTENQYVRAKFDGPLKPEEWYALQRVLDGKATVSLTMPRKKLNPAYPLRRFLKCSKCNAPTLGYPAKSKTGKIYHYYSCPNRDCHYSIGRDEGHRAFLEFLKKAAPSKELLALFREIVLEQWAERYKLLTQESTEWAKKVKKTKDEKAKLVSLMKQNHDNPDLMAEFKKDFEQVSREHAEALASRNTKEAEHLDAEKVVTHCIYFLGHARKLWEKAPVEDKYRLQQLIFPNGVTHDALIGKQTPKLSPVYEAIQTIDGDEKPLVAPRRIELRLAD